MLPHRQAGKCASVLLGTAVIALTLSQIHAPAGLAEGGTFGFSLLLYHQFGLSPAVSGFFLDMLLLLLCAARVFGRAFAISSSRQLRMKCPTRVMRASLPTVT